ncbi:oxidoreductase [Aliikangiella sp. IMCC44359]|uniref:oxidoreductase n=1 Tax=Aliikangiella sp. IMCC44359 TaxID=3459125 RepID=UPI00403AE947
MKIVCVGGGPASLYFAISIKLKDPSHQITIFERNKSDSTFGWGVVLSDDVMNKLSCHDQLSADAIRDSFAHWDNISVVYKSEVVTSGGHGFSGISRLKLLQILTQRAKQLGVEFKFSQPIEPNNSKELNDADLILAADGRNSKLRELYQENFGTQVEFRKNKFIWLGTYQKFNDAFTFIFEKTAHGWLWGHCYQFDDSLSTVIIECEPETWLGLKFDQMSCAQSIKQCELIFKSHLGGNELINNAKHLAENAWINFPVVKNEKWYYKNIVLLGDAAHTAHFSIGSGTRLAIEDAMELASCLDANTDLTCALEEYQNSRKKEVKKIQQAAFNSTLWFENIQSHTDLSPLQFAYSLLTRSQRLGHEQLRLRDSQWISKVESWFASLNEKYPNDLNKSLVAKESLVPQPIFVPFGMGQQVLKNRIVVRTSLASPIDIETLKKAGAVLTEQMWLDPDNGELVTVRTNIIEKELAKIVQLIQKDSLTRVGAQLAHPKICLVNDSDSYNHLNESDMDKIINDYMNAVARVIYCQFDLLELYFKSDCWLSRLLSPQYNLRTDQYGGCLENRMRFPLALLKAIRKVWPIDKPLSLNISAACWQQDLALDPEDVVKIMLAFKAAGVDWVDVIMGNSSSVLSEYISGKTGLARMSVKSFEQKSHLNALILSGRTDLFMLSKSTLENF